MLSILFSQENIVIDNVFHWRYWYRSFFSVGVIVVNNIFHGKYCCRNEILLSIFFIENVVIDNIFKFFVIDKRFCVTRKPESFCFEGWIKNLQDLPWKVGLKRWKILRVFNKRNKTLNTSRISWRTYFKYSIPRRRLKSSLHRRR